MIWSGSWRIAERVSVWLMSALWGARKMRARILPEAARSSLFALAFRGMVRDLPLFWPGHDRLALPAPLRAARPGLLHPAKPRVDGLDAHRPRGSQPGFPPFGCVSARTCRGRSRVDGHRWRR